MDKRQQVTQQYRAVAHLAGQIAAIHAEASSILPHAPEGVVDIMGSRSARLMEVFGDILNGMDAADPGDEWIDPIYDEAHLMFPQESTAPSRPVEAAPQSSEPNRAIRTYIALKILRAWNSGTAGYDAHVVFIVNEWIDGGMKGSIPWPDSPFFAEWAKKNSLVNVGHRVGYLGGAYFCGACNELLVLDQQPYCHKCGNKLACDHGVSHTDYCAPCGRTVSE